MVDFPNVPDFPGVPALRRNLSAPVAQLVALVADAFGLLSAGEPQQWGIFLNGVPVVQPDTVISVSKKHHRAIAEYQLQQGAFESYNKVDTPFVVHMRMVKGGSLSARQDFIESVEAIAATLDLYDVVTPESTITSVSISDIDYDRKAANVGLVIFDITLQQVRVTASAQFTTTPTTNAAAAAGSGATSSDTRTVITIRDPQSPSAAPQTSGGNVQPVAPTGGATPDFNLLSG